MTNKLHIKIYTSKGYMSSDVIDRSRHTHAFFQLPAFIRPNIYRTELINYPDYFRKDVNELPSRSYIRFSIEHLLLELENRNVAYTLITNDNYAVDELFKLAINDKLGTLWVIDLYLYKVDNLVYEDTFNSINSAVSSYNNYLQELTKV